MTEIDFLCQRTRHLPQLAAWLHSRWLWRAGIDLDGASALLRRRLRENSFPLALVATVDHATAGTVSLDGVPKGTPDANVSVELRGLYVCHTHRGLGLGTRLCLRALEEARRLGARHVLVRTFEAEPFFLRLGWEITGSDHVRLGLSVQGVTTMLRSCVVDSPQRH